jgi:UDP-glucose 4-epimerase
VGGTFNVCTGVETTVQTLFDDLQRAAGTSLTPELAPLREGELERSCMDPSRAAERLSWHAQVELAEGLATTYRDLTAAFAADDGAG